MEDRHEIKTEQPVIRVVVVVRGGLVDDVYCSQPGVERVVIDYDLLEGGTHLDEAFEQIVNDDSFHLADHDPDLKCVEAFNGKVNDLIKELEAMEA